MSRSVKSSRQSFWLSHLQRAQAERISVRAYARREGLSEQSLHATRRKQSISSLPAPRAASAFAAVRIAGVQREAARPARLAHWRIVVARQCLHGRHLAARMRAHGDAVGDGVHANCIEAVFAAGVG